MKDQLTRIKELIFYPKLLSEEMETSDYFKDNSFQEDKETKSLSTEVGIDPENDVEHRLALIMRFTNVGGYEELVFYFSLLDKKNQFVKGKETMYSRKESDQYIPKQLKGTIVFFNKLKEMFKKLITMEKPNIFFMETYENYVDEKQLLPFRNIIPIILENGYVIEQEGYSHDKRKYQWKFVQKTEQQIKESKADGFSEFIKTFKKDDAYWKKFNEETRIILEKLYK